LDNTTYSLFFDDLGVALVQLQLALGLVNYKFFLPETLDLVLVFQLAHATLLCIHLLKTLVFCKLLHQPLLEFILHAALLGSTFSLKTHLEVLSLLELLLSALTLFSLCSLLSEGRLFAFLEVQLIAEIFLEFFFGSAFHLFGFQFSENAIASLLSCVLGSLDLVKAHLLLFSVLADHFVFILLHFLLATLESSLLVYGEDHVGLRLLHLLGCDAGHFTIFINHTVYNVVNLTLFLLVLLEGLAFQIFGQINLVLNRGLVLSELTELLAITFALHLVLNFFTLQVVFINVGVVFLKNN
jgi:hypothetical protein